jgi:proteasome lid subunit RPN8/RPN11
MMREHTASRTDIEVGGLVVGKFAAHGDIAFVLVVAALPALLADGSHGFLRITAEAGVEMDRLRGERYPDLRVVGWYHSHPRFGIFLSGTDLGTHHTAFKNGPFVAFVLDPVNSKDGVFGWENGQVVGPIAHWLLHTNA